MLLELSIRNFAVVSELRLALGPGLSVFTGETGAGKSIVIEALGFLLGGRASPDWLRGGADRLEVQGVFDARGFPDEVRRSFGLAKEATIRRELDASGRTKATINGKAASLPVLAAVAERLADFHGQHEHQTLLRPAVQLELLDGFGGLEAERAAAAEAYRAWRELQGQLERLRVSDAERERLVDLHRFQLKEIDDVAPRPGEEEELAAELPRLKHAAKLGELAERAHGLLYGEEGSAQELLSKAEDALAEMARLDPGMAPAAEALARSREAVDETATRLAEYREQAEAGPERLDELLGRQDKLDRLKKKYGPGLAEVLAFRERTAAELSRLENHAERSAELEAALARAEKDLAGRCERLHKERMKAAKRLGERVQAELKDLGMPAARFSVSVEMEEGAWSPTGCDRAEFLLAPNPGEGLKTLRAAASGGELSRVMLALKGVLARQDRVGLLVFDEVDTGVGAMVGRVVGEKLAQLGASRQVLCVTHLPQVASKARAHFLVSKSVSGGRTTTKVERLEGEARLEALAQMLGGRKATEASRAAAKELLESV